MQKSPTPDSTFNFAVALSSRQRRNKHLAQHSFTQIDDLAQLTALTDA